MLLAALAAMSHDFLPPLDGEVLTPQDGQPAFTWYGGAKYVGVLGKSNPMLTRPDVVNYTHVYNYGRIYTAEQYTGPHSDKYIYVGYDGPTIWDASAGMWAAHADHD